MADSSDLAGLLDRPRGGAVVAGARPLPAANASPAKGARARKRDPERTSAAILEAATQEFSQKGYAGARVDAIAKRAKINKRMLYHYFGGKDGLYLAVLEQSYAAIRSAETKLDLAHHEPVESMRQLVHFTWSYYLERPEFLAILATENQHRARFLKQSDRIVQLNSPLITAICEVLAHGAAQKVFRDVSWIPSSSISASPLSAPSTSPTAGPSRRSSGAISWRARRSRHGASTSPIW